MWLGCKTSIFQTQLLRHNGVSNPTGCLAPPTWPGCFFNNLFSGPIKSKTDTNPVFHQIQKRKLYLESNDQNYALSRGLMNQDVWQRKRGNGFPFPRFGLPDISPVLVFSVINRHHHQRKRLLRRIVVSSHTDNNSYHSMGLPCASSRVKHLK